MDVTPTSVAEPGNVEQAASMPVNRMAGGNARPRWIRKGRMERLEDYCPADRAPITRITAGNINVTIRTGKTKRVKGTTSFAGRA